MDILKLSFTLIGQILKYPLFVLGKTTITPLTFIYVTVMTMLLSALARTTKIWTLHLLQAEERLDATSREAVASFLKFMVLVTGFGIILQTAGVELSALTVMAGALSFGISFGLQNITSNLISGVIIQLERPIKVGDRVQVGDITGNVISISLRATRIKTKTNAIYIVPNTEFITGKIVNWNHDGALYCDSLSIRVAAENDAAEVRTVLLDTIRQGQLVSQQPAPTVRLNGLNKDALEYTVNVYVSGTQTDIEELRSKLYIELAAKLKASAIKLA